MLADYHVHTEFSDDSVYPMEQVIKDAIAMKMNEICFTDHVDYGIKEDWDCGHPIAYRGEEPLANVDYPQYFAKIEELRHIYRSSYLWRTDRDKGGAGIRYADAYDSAV